MNGFQTLFLGGTSKNPQGWEDQLYKDPGLLYQVQPEELHSYLLSKQAFLVLSNTCAYRFTQRKTSLITARNK